MTDLPPIRDVIKRHGLAATKALGQNFLLDEQGFKVFRICPEDYPGFGHMPKLEPVTTREQIFNLPHSDLLMKRG